MLISSNAKDIAKKCLPILESCLESIKDQDINRVDAIRIIRAHVCNRGICFLYKKTFAGIRKNPNWVTDGIKEIRMLPENSMYWYDIPDEIFFRGGSKRQMINSLKKRIEILKKVTL